MNSFVEIANGLANLWVGAMWPIIWQSVVLAGAVYFVTLCLRGVSAAVRFWLWMLVPLRLLVMPLITVSLPLLPAVTQPASSDIKPVSAEALIAEPAAFRAIETVPVAEEFEPMPTAMEKADVVSTRIWPNVWAFMMGGWLAGIAFWSARLIRGWCRIRNIAGGAAEIREAQVLALGQKAATMLGVRRVPRVLVTEKSVSPFLSGVLRPVLVIPAGLVGEVRGEALLAVFAHEFAHLRRQDPLVGWVLAICEAIYFFHPVLHFVKHQILFERERACDDWVVATSKTKRSIYANALISAADVCRTFSAKMGPVGVVAESFGDLKKRLIAIGSNLEPKARLSLSALILLVIIGAICVPGIVLTARSTTRAENKTAQAVKDVTPSKTIDPVRLSTVRELVARNEALVSLIKMDYTVRFSRTGQPPESRTGKRRPGRRFSHSNCVWAQDGEKHYTRVDYFYGPNEPARSSVSVFNAQLITEGRLPELTQGTIRYKNQSDWYKVPVAKLGFRPFEGQYILSQILVPEHASLHDDIEIVNGRETYVVDARRPTVPRYFVRIWIDRERGMPLQIRYFGKHPNWGDEKSMSQINDIKLHQLPNGGWIPVQGVRSLRSGDSYISVDINSITVQREDIPEFLFRINFPDGARIYNAISGLTFVQGKPKKNYEEIVLSGGNFIAGVVVDENGLPVPDVVVRVDYLKTPRSDGGFDLKLIGAHDHPCTTTDAQGRFAIELEKDSIYDLRFLSRNHAAIIANDVPVDKKDLKVTLEEGGTVTGRVVRIENGQKVPFVNVEVKTEQSTRNVYAHLGFDSNRKTLTDSQGRFRFEHLRTKMRDFKSDTLRQPQYVPRTWTISCGQASKTIAFHDGIRTEDVELVLQPVLSEVRPLIGRPLPKFDGIKIDLAGHQTKGKMILVCYFDMEQRPSRYCIRELAKRAEELKERGVYVVAVQASKVDENTLNKWVLEYTIPFPVGMVEGDINETRYSWSVQSLPWLILTDRNHVVTAEGFTLNELNDKIKGAGKN